MKRKTVTMALTVSVPTSLSAAEVRREIRTRINELCGYFSHLESEDVKVRKIGPTPRHLEGRS
jgi:hypothetical protein